MEFACSLCGYQSEWKKHVKTHIGNKNKCGPGEAEILEIPMEIMCEYCFREFSTQPNLKRHLRTCKVKQTDLKADLAKKDAKIKELEGLLAQKPTINITNNVTQNIIIQLRPWNDPKLPDDMDDIYEDAWNQRKSIPLFIERLHLNDELQKNHSLCITNLKTKLAKVFTEQGWITKDQDKFLDEIITQSNRLMDKWVKAKKNRREYENDFVEYLEEVGKKQFNEDTRKELKFMLYDAYKNGMVNPKSRTKECFPLQDDDD